MGFFTKLFSSKKVTAHQKLLRKYASCNDLQKSQIDLDFPPNSRPTGILSAKAHDKRELYSITHENMDVPNNAEKQANLGHPLNMQRSTNTEERCPFMSSKENFTELKVEEPSKAPKSSGRCPFDHSSINKMLSMPDTSVSSGCPFDQPLMNPYELPLNTKTTEPTILEILGEDRVELLVERFYHYNLTDRKTRIFFQGVNIERLQRMQTTFLIHLLGGRQMNMTKMRAAHKRLLDLNDSHFDAVMKNLTKAAKDLGISPKLTVGILAAAETTRDDVLGRVPKYDLAQQRYS
ncbi:hypothetical protein K7432_014779 [Basidiobolus ranarum]|uniref:Globin-like protein n=1 Tax=Basidiobolus ranarum TaxID=34480 RepID=A0ABR2VP04_9FUNG